MSKLFRSDPASTNDARRDARRRVPETVGHLTSRVFEANRRHVRVPEQHGQRQARRYT